MDQTQQQWIDQAGHAIYDRITGPRSSPMKQADKETLSEVIQVGCVIIKALLDIRDAQVTLAKIERMKAGWI